MDYSPKSHPSKLLVDHKKGVLSFVDITDLILIAVVFHDVGKMNHNFQKKINGLPYTGYSNHAYISTYYLINAFVNNKETIKNRFTFINDDNFEQILLILCNVIIGHHGYLRNITEIFSNDDEWQRMIEYLKSNSITDNVNTFFKQHRNLLNCDLNFIDDINNSEFYRSYGRIDDINKWKNNAINYYFETIIAFSELVTGDRRDASGNIKIIRNETKKKIAYSLENNLEWLFNKFNSNNELNKVRNEIRKTAVDNLIQNLNTNNRVFTLTAPTGSGKTLMMLQLAVEILKITNHDYDIIYSLPYLSIIDQTTKIINNDLRIETLNYTSASDTSTRLQKMIENGGESKNLVEYAFSENCFDHSFIITTFNQLFETFLNNSTSKLIKLKNFKKRIFLIDEFQAINYTQYYTLLNLLNEFCKKYDSFAIISTATMPSFKINMKSINTQNVKTLFKNNFYPIELLSDDVFNYNVFNRYKIHFIGEKNQYTLYQTINNSSSSCLLILNTIRTSQILYGQFISDSTFEKIYLLNAHICPADRLFTINQIQNDLKTNKKILVVSTQVIEAGVDISFPVVYRDAAPPSSVVQANGRGNRNGEFGIIDTYLFLFKNDNNNLYDCDMVYQNTIPQNFKNDIKNMIEPMTEKEFHKRCQKYFIGLGINCEHGKVNDEQNIVNDILNGDFLKIGKYKLIQGDPDTHTIYVGKNEKLWNEYTNTYIQMKQADDYKSRDIANIEFKKIRGIILQNSINIRTNVFELINVDESDVFGVYRLSDDNQYNSNFGLIPI